MYTHKIDYIINMKTSTNIFKASRLYSLKIDVYYPFDTNKINPCPPKKCISMLFKQQYFDWRSSRFQSLSAKVLKIIYKKITLFCLSHCKTTLILMYSIQQTINKWPEFLILLSTWDKRLYKERRLKFLDKRPIFKILM